MDTEDPLAASARKLAETMPPIDALRAWMLLLVDYIAAKHIIALLSIALLEALPGSMKALAA